MLSPFIIAFVRSSLADYSFLNSEFQTVTAGKFKRTLTPTKKVTKEDKEKQKEDLEDILSLFKDFVKENRPSLDIDAVATGETWFGNDALDKGLCDEIKTVDDVLVEYVDSGFNVFEVRYSPPVNSPSLGSLLPIGKAGETNQGSMKGVLRWLVKAINEIIVEEIGTGLGGETVKDRYLMRDPVGTKENFRIQK